ncbi:MAG: hypothetical protein SFX73_30550 [Kofleriaceae bacterium]|nr:hypothetical protein [Kofleriaceae bacterium]
MLLARMLLLSMVCLPACAIDDEAEPEVIEMDGKADGEFRKPLSLAAQGDKAKYEVRCSETIHCDVDFRVRMADPEEFPEGKHLLTATITRNSDGARAVFHMTRDERPFDDETYQTSWKQIESTDEGELQADEESLVLDSWRGRDVFNVELERVYKSTRNLRLGVEAVWH